MDSEKRQLPSDQVNNARAEEKHDPSGSQSNSSMAAPSQTQPNGIAPITKHAQFCAMIGMPPNYETEPYPTIWNIFSRRDRKYKGLYPRVRYAYQWHTLQYWLVGTLSNTLLWLQICFGAALTALGGTKSDRVSIAIILLGALQTVFGGFLTYFKSRNQPNRARQFRNSLKKVLNAIENSEEMLRDPSWEPPPYTPSKDNSHGMDTSISATWLVGGANQEVKGVEGLVYRLMDMYLDAVKEAEANYPDYWVVTSRTGQWAITPNPLRGLQPGNVVTGDGVTSSTNARTGAAPMSLSGSAESTQQATTGTAGNRRAATGLPGQDGV